MVNSRGEEVKVEQQMAGEVLQQVVPCLDNLGWEVNESVETVMINKGECGDGQQGQGQGGEDGATDGW